MARIGLRPHVFLALGVVVSLFMFSGVASAGDDRCVNTVNKWAAKVAKAQAGDTAKCIKDGGRGDPIPIELCLTSDLKGKVGKTADKLNQEVRADCAEGPPAIPPIDTSDPNALSQIMIDKELALIHAIFGTDLDQVVFTKDDDKDGWKCQSAIARAVGKCEDAKLASYNSCKKDQLKAGAADAATLQDACLGTGANRIPDTKGKISKKCGNGLGGTIGKNCGTTNNDALFAPCAGRDLGACIDQKIDCEVCKALNALDGLDRNCDQFDDGVMNDSCEGGPPIGMHKCVLDPNWSGGSSMLISAQALPLPPFSISGSLDLSCGAIDPWTGKAVCECTLQELEPIQLIGIGFFCFTPGSGCTTGEIDCDGGNASDVGMEFDHNIGSCADNPDCEAQCTVHCAGLGMQIFDSGCEGFCKGGALDGQPCTVESECPGGVCNGRNGLPHGSICQCGCIDIGGNPSRPGGLQCNLNLNFDIETDLPCGDGDVLIAFGTRCVPLTSEASMFVIHNTNNVLGKDFPPGPPWWWSGAPIACEDLAASATTSLNLTGAMDFLDSTISDLGIWIDIVCE
jgi:hypothetical protein